MGEGGRTREDDGPPVDSSFTSSFYWCDNRGLRTIRHKARPEQNILYLGHLRLELPPRLEEAVALPVLWQGGGRGSVCRRAQDRGGGWAPAHPVLMGRGHSWDGRQRKREGWVVGRVDGWVAGWKLKFVSQERNGSLCLLLLPLDSENPCIPHRNLRCSRFPPEALTHSRWNKELFPAGSRGLKNVKRTQRNPPKPPLNRAAGVTLAEATSPDVRAAGRSICAGGLGGVGGGGRAGGNLEPISSTDVCVTFHGCIGLCLVRPRSSSPYQREPFPKVIRAPSSP